ncbi:Gfo/Idh/MocA family protein [Streptomyces litchfieldiae]|uniref:Gfo/Idh/MocA family oxidoreductase n=1 Tax=Streptomyces litchfieldiae TaxID=3075543 RepID=A0ABU2MVY2_9ACTN|nr:Gfo/Idh/MocA family oxidoreductase [Streptomyces sp. DSM 44938]MDT0345754.1 Gfo/Idh/MocA family oxidoreductase [Streptomyces sp. DSM 44938]
MTAPTFRTVSGDRRPLRVIVVGAGGMGRAWLSTVRSSPDVTLAGVVDLDPLVARAAAEAAGAPEIPTGTDLTALAAATDPDAVIDVTVPAAHLPVTLEALSLGLPVLGEKPVAETLPEALRLTAAAELSGRLFMVSQSRRYNRQLFRFKDQARRLGAPGILTTEFFLAPRFGGFRDAMDHPLLLDMAIHPFDTARFLLDAEPVSVYCQEYNPSWSWYRGDAATTAIFEMTGGTRYIYTGSWCSPGLETSWNGSWRLSGELGSACWNGDDPAVVEAPDAPPAGAPVPAPSAGGAGGGIAGALAEFVHALRTGTVPMGEVHENVMSLAMVAAAVQSASTDRRVVLDEVLDTARAEALAAADGEVRELIGSWSSVRDALTARAENPVGHG